MLKSITSLISLEIYLLFRSILNRRGRRLFGIVILSLESNLKISNSEKAYGQITVMWEQVQKAKNSTQVEMKQRSNPLKNQKLPQVFDY